MRFGCCLNMTASRPDKTGMEYLDALEAAGYDYVELPLAEMMQLDPREFEALKEKLEHMKIHCETCNNFFPATFRLTGENTDMELIMNYVEKALLRAGSLGVSYVVFGSGGAKQVPDGFPLERGYGQVVKMLKKIGPAAAKYGIVICIEPLRKAECNLINTFEEGCRLARDVDHPNVRVLVDYYHMTVEQEPAEHIRIYGNEFLRHVHFARAEGRVYPKSLQEEDYGAFLQALRDIGYDERISCEAYSENFERDAKDALEFLKSVWA